MVVLCGQLWDFTSTGCQPLMTGGFLAWSMDWAVGLTSWWADRYVHVNQWRGFDTWLEAFSKSNAALARLLASLNLLFPGPVTDELSERELFASLADTLQIAFEYDRQDATRRRGGE